MSLYIISGSNDNELHKIDDTGTNVWTYTGHSSNVNAVSVDADGNVYSGGSDNEVHKIDSSGSNVWEYTGHTSYVFAVTADSDGNVYSGGNDNEVHKIDSSGSNVWTYTGHTNGVYGVAVDSDGNVYSCGNDNEVHKIDSSGSNVWKYTGHSNRVWSVAVDADGYVYSASEDNEVHKIDSSGSNVWEYTGHSDDVMYVAVDVDGNVYSGGKDNEVHKIDSSGSNVWEYTGHTDSVNGVAVDIYGGIYSASNDNEVHKIKADGSGSVWTYTDHTDNVTAVAVGYCGATATTNSATNIGATQATLNGKIDYHNETISVYFEYRKTSAGTWNTTTSESYTATTTFSKEVTGLDYNTEYEYRAVAEWTDDGTTYNDYGDTVTFTTDDVPTATTTYPDTESINAANSQTFTWNPDTENQTKYELEYRKTGGTYTSTGEVTSTTAEHTFAADTFDYQEDYEWRVKVWEDADGTILEGEWSTVTSYDTVQLPTLSNPIPADSAEINIGIIDISVLVNHNYDLDTTVDFEIADNASYTDSTTITSDTVNDGEQAEVEYGITVPDTYYVKMQATDSAGETSSLLEISFSATQTLYFIETPSVNTSGPKATHVTVYSKETSAEYTDSLSGISADEKIEKYIEIEKGDAGVCQDVAESLLDKWGVEQVSVSGKIDMTVILDFKKKVEVIISEANIDGYYVLQSKQHDILNQTTTIEAGDIILSDNELLARILDEL